MLNNEQAHPYGGTMQTWSRKLRWLLVTLLPSFLIPLVTRRPSISSKVYSTSWLDGMRGYAAFAVFMRHYEFCHHRKGLWSWGTINDQNSPHENKFLVQLPIVRLLYHGEGMVCLFFVISGYALSFKALKLTRRSSYNSLMRSLSSSTFRRPFRLFLPCIASTMVIFTALRIGVYDYPNSTFAEDEGIFRSLWLGFAKEPQPHIFDNIWDQAADYYKATPGLFSIITRDHWPSHGYDPHLWTIPVEFRCSMVLFLTIAGLAYVRARTRMAILALITMLSFQFDVWELGLFWGGMLIAESSLVRQEMSSLDGKINEGLPVFDRRDLFGQNFKRAIWYIGCFVGLVFLSCPSQLTNDAPLYSTLVKFVPPGLRVEEHFRFWCSMGSLLVVWSVDHEKVLQKPFACAVGRYMGSISYALYLMHGLVNQTVGYTVVYLLWKYVTGRDTMAQYETGVALGGIITVAVCVWVADLFWRFVDVPIVRLTKWLEEQVFVPQAEE